MKITKNIIVTLIAILPLLVNAQNKNNFIKHSFFRHALKPSVKTSYMEKVAGSISLPGKSQNYSWDSTSGKWIWNFEAITKYDSKGRALFYTEIGDTLLNDTSYKANTSYDATGSLFATDYSKNPLLLQATGLDTNIVDNKGGQVRQVHYSRDTTNTIWLLSSGLKNLNTYDVNGNLISVQESDYDAVNMVWTNALESDFTLNADGSWKTVTEKSWDGSSWVNQFLNDSIVWKSWKGSPYFGNNNSLVTSTVQMVWNGTKWLDSLRFTTTYDANGGSIETDEAFTAGKWINSSRYTNMMDSLGNGTGQKSESWNAGAWGLDFSDLRNYTYNVKGDIMQEIDENFNTSTMKYENTTKEVYSDFSTILAISEAVKANVAVSMYPNPAKETIRIQVNLPSSDKVSIRIVNMLGEVVLNDNCSGNIMTSGINLQLNNLASGLYIIHITSGNQEISRKLIKE